MGARRGDHLAVERLSRCRFRLLGGVFPREDHAIELDELQHRRALATRVLLAHGCESAASQYLQQLSGADRPRVRVVYCELVLDDLAQGVARQTLDEVKKTRTLERGQLLSGES